MRSLVITLCGSAKFEPLFHHWNEILTLSGHTVFGLSVYPSFKNNTKDWYTGHEKMLLDKAHLRKIDNSDAIFVINKFAYIGQSTLSEINYAKKLNRELYALESWGAGCGIGVNHDTAHRRKAMEMGCFQVPSPIDTTYPNFKHLHRLLPEAGEYRSSLVERNDRFNVEYMR